MANQFPNVFPGGFAGNAFDFNKAKVDRSGAVRYYKGVVAVPAGTPAGAKIGIVPVLKGAFVLPQASAIWSDALDTSSTATASVGVTYQPSSTTAEAPAAYVAAGNTTLRAGGNIPLNGTQGGQTYAVQDNGWIAVTLAAAATNQAGNISYSIAISYDVGALQ